MGGRRGWLLVSVVVVGLSYGRPARGALGDLDTTFGNGSGLVLKQLGLGAMPVSEAVDMRIRPNGKIFVGGVASDANGHVASTLARYLPDGTFDPSFGTGGSGAVSLQFGAGAMPQSIFFYSGLALQDDGKIIGCGLATDANGRGAALIARFTSAGMLDSSFASGGAFNQNLGLGATPGTNIFGCAIQPDGKVVAVGGRTDASGNNNVLAIRLTTSGTPDPTFGSGGIYAQQLSPSATTPTSVAADLRIMGDGKIVMSLAVEDTDQTTAMAIARITSTGSLDPTFGTGGLTITNFGGATPFSEGVQLGIQPSGKFVVSGDGDDVTDHRAFVMARYTASGALDGSFGTGGKVTSQLSGAATPSSTAIAQVIQPDGKIVLIGSSSEMDGTTPLAIARYTTEGNLDPTFGTGGIVKKQFGTGATANTQGIGGVFTPSGKLLVDGAAGTSSTDLAWFVASFDADIAPIASFTVTPPTPNVGDAVNLNGSASSDSDGTIVKYEWDLDGDGTYGDATGVTTSTSFATGGTHNVALRVTDEVGAEGTSVVPVQVACGTAASYASVGCRIAGLQASVDAQVPAGAIHDKLATALSTASSLVQAAQAAGPGKTAKKNLTKAGKQIGKFMGGVRKGKKTIPADVRAALLDVAKSVKSSIKQLKKT